MEVRIMFFGIKFFILLTLFVAISTILSIIGIVFSILGFKSSVNIGKARIGFILSILSLILPWIIYFFTLMIATFL